MEDPGDGVGVGDDLVKDLAAKEDAVRTPTGVAARTLGLLRADALFDAGATAALGLPAATDRSFDLHAWDFSETGEKTAVSPTGGVLGLELTASPVLLVEP